MQLSATELQTLYDRILTFLAREESINMSLMVDEGQLSATNIINEVIQKIEYNPGLETATKLSMHLQNFAVSH